MALWINFRPGRWKTALVIFFSVGLFSNLLLQIQRHFYGVKPGVTLEGLPMDGFLEREVRAIVWALAIEKSCPPRDATIMPGTGEIYPERTGLRVLIEPTVRKVMAAPPETPVFLQVRVLYPRLTAADLAQITKVIGSFQTALTGSPERINNIRLAAQKINYILLKPGEIFSFNKVVGPRTQERGYLPAPVIINETHEMGFGGGVCQVATTLYNGALKAGLKIIERHRHTKDVHYVAPGRDATVTYPYLDLKFQNTTGYPIIIRSAVGGGQVSFWILGKN